MIKKILILEFAAILVVNMLFYIYLNSIGKYQLIMILSAVGVFILQHVLNLIDITVKRINAAERNEMAKKYNKLILLNTETSFLTGLIVFYITIRVAENNLEAFYIGLSSMGLFAWAGMQIIYFLQKKK